MEHRPLLVFVPDRTGRPDSVKPLRDFLTSQRLFLDALVLPCEFSLPWWSNRGMSQISTQIGSQIDAFYLRNQKLASTVVVENRR
jgi:hypothetical protein